MKCSINDCQTQIGLHGAKGFCTKHYKRFTKHGDPLYEYKHEIVYCKIEGCKERAHAHKLCSNHIYEYKKENKLLRIHDCKCIVCLKDFKSHTKKSLYCSRDCFYKNSKQERIGEGNPSFRNGFYVKTANKTIIYHKEREFTCIKHELQRNMIDKKGYIYCEHCGVTNSLKFENHHLIFRSEKPKHDNLHNIRNIIHLCIVCHNNFHKDKHKMREKYIEERNLIELFGNDIMPLNNHK